MTTLESDYEKGMKIKGQIKTNNTKAGKGVVWLTLHYT